MDVREKLVELLDDFVSHEYNTEELVDELIAHGITVQSEIDAKTFQLMREFERLKEKKESLANAVNVLEEINSDLCKQIKCVTVQEWISVKDRFPEHGDVVLCFMKFGEHRILQWDNVSSWWLGYGQGDDWQKADVTHWAKMPQPPKGE